MNTTLLTLTTLFLGAATSVAAQDGRPDPGPWQASRAELYSLANASTGDQAQVVRARLANGDFHTGDRVVLFVEGEPLLTDTFAVTEARTLLLPIVGEVDMAGVLRSEVEPHLTQAVARYLRDPTVRATPLMHLGVIGAVGRPGFYDVVPSVPLDQVLMIAGGLVPDAQVDKLKVERDGEDMPEEFQRALMNGRPVASLGFRSGDRIVVPARRERTLTALQIAALAVTIPLGVVGLATAF